MTGTQGAQALGGWIVVVVAICVDLAGFGCGARTGSNPGGGFVAHIGVDAKQHADVITLVGGGPDAKALSLSAAEHEVQTRHVAQKRIDLDVQPSARMGTVASFAFFATTNGFALTFGQGTQAQRAGGAAFADALAAALMPKKRGEDARPVLIDIGPTDQIVIERSKAKIDALPRLLERAANRRREKGAAVVVVVTPDPASDWGTTVDVMAAIARSGIRDVRLGLVE